MKQLLLSLCTIFVIVGSAYAEVLSNNAHIVFTVGSVKSLTLLNKQGRVEIDRVVGKRDIVVNVTMKATGKNASEAQTILNGITIEKSQKGDAAGVYTVISSSKSLKKLFVGLDYSVDYKVTVPWGIELSIVNEGGSIMVPNYGDRLTVQASNCNVFIGDVTGEAPCKVVANKGNVVLKGAELLNADMEGCNYEIGRVLNATIKAKSATGSINSATLLNTNLTEGSLSIATVEDMSGTSTDCKIEVGDMGDCMTFDMVRGSILVKNIHYSFDKIMLDAVWADVTMNFMHDSGYNLTLQHDKRLKVEMPSDLKLGHLSSSTKKLIIGSAYYGNKSRQSDVRIRMTAGSLKIGTTK